MRAVALRTSPPGDCAAVERVPPAPPNGGGDLLARYRLAQRNVDAARRNVDAAKRAMEAPGASHEAVRVHEAARRELSSAARALIAAGVDRVLAARGERTDA